MPDDLNAFVADQIENGGYNNQSDVVRDALRLLRTRAEARQQINAKLDRGIADGKAGRTKPFTPELLDTVIAKCIDRFRL